ncbi:MAG: hypothetical protein ACYCUV_06510, partial [Phycisphaerae bacterium]
MFLGGCGRQDLEVLFADQRTRINMATGSDQRTTINVPCEFQLAHRRCSSSGGKVLKLSKLMGALILAGFL